MLYGELPDVDPGNGGLKVRGILVRIPNPKKTAVIRLPTNAEMVERLSKEKFVRRDEGRGQTKVQFTPNTKADLELFNKLRLDQGGADFDEFEAAKAIAMITYCEPTGYEAVGDQFVIDLKTSLGKTRHTLNIPFERDLMIYRRGVTSSRGLPHGQVEIRYPPDPPVTLYDAVVVNIEGYAESYQPTDVPPHHKAAVVAELVLAIDNELDPAIDPNS